MKICIHLSNIIPSSRYSKQQLFKKKKNTNIPCAILKEKKAKKKAIMQNLQAHKKLKQL